MTGIVHNSSKNLEVEQGKGTGGSSHVIEARQISKNFGKTQAVKSVSFTVSRGEVFGFFGPNGAGKTTVIRLLCGLTSLTAGAAAVCGCDVRSESTYLRRNLAIMPEENSYYEKMTPKSYFDFFARMAGHTSENARNRIEMATRIAETTSFMNKRISELSHGQRQKISIARVFLSDIPVMFLDEPFQGIDIIHRKSLREYLRDYVAKGNTVFYTSHNLIEAEHLVDRFAFIDAGRILTIGTARELRDRYLLPSYAIRVSDLAKAQKLLSEGLVTTECFVKGSEIILTLKESRDVPKIAVLLGSAGIALFEMRQLGTMEEVFLRMREDKVINI